MARQGGLGRGLGSLIPVASVVSESGLRELAITAIQPNPYQPRHDFDEETLASLSASIAEVGVLQPVLVRPVDGSYQLIAGERRWRAAKRAGLVTIPAIVQERDDAASLQAAIIENLHRQDLNVFEEGAAFQQLIEEFGLTHDQVATRVGKSRAAISNTLRMLQLPARIQRMVIQGELSAGHARALLGSPDRSFQLKLAETVVRDSLTVRDTEESVRRQLLGDEGTSTAPRLVSTLAEGIKRRPAVVVELEQLLSDAFATDVRIEVRRSQSGRVVVDFGDLEDLHRIATMVLDPGR
ncbi:MAG: ParB/RepB/Spo0J family partition protein [Ferrimicrobium sp.]